MSTETNILPIVGLSMASVHVNNRRDEIEMVTVDGRRFRMEHFQDCCEVVEVEDICGELDWLIGSEITQAEETIQVGAGDDDGSQTWTFYRIGTAKGLVVIRWCGSSNGYYSERVDFHEVMA